MKMIFTYYPLLSSYVSQVHAWPVYSSSQHLRGVTSSTLHTPGCEH